MVTAALSCVHLWISSAISWIHGSLAGHREKVDSFEVLTGFAISMER